MYYNDYQNYQEPSTNHSRKGRADRTRQQSGHYEGGFQQQNQYSNHGYVREPEYQPPNSYHRYEEEAPEHQSFQESEGSTPARKIQLFIGGIPPNVNEKMFKNFFESFGPMSECRMVIDKVTRRKMLTSGQPRGFGFVTFVNHSDTLKVLNKRVIMSGKEIECKDAISKNDSNVRVSDEKTRKVFVGGLPSDVTEEQMRAYFAQYGRLLTCRIVYNQDLNISRGFGFVIYADKESAEKVVEDREHHYLNGKWVDCKSALLRQEMNPSDVGSTVSKKSGGKSNAGGHDRPKKNGHSGSDKSSKGNKNKKFNLAKNNYPHTPQLTASSVYSGQGTNFAEMSYARNLPVAASPASHAHGTRNQLHINQQNQYPNGKTKAMTPGVRNRNFGQYSAPFQGNNQQYHQILSAVEMEDDYLGSPQHGTQFYDSLQSPIPTPVHKGGFQAAYTRTVKRYYRDPQSNSGFPGPVMEDEEFILETPVTNIQDSKPKLMLPIFEEDDMSPPSMQQPTYTHPVIPPSPKVVQDQKIATLRPSLDLNVLAPDHQPSPLRSKPSFNQMLPQAFLAEQYDQLLPKYSFSPRALRAVLIGLLPNQSLAHNLILHKIGFHSPQMASVLMKFLFGLLSS